MQFAVVSTKNYVMTAHTVLDGKTVKSKNLRRCLCTVMPDKTQ